MRLKEGLSIIWRDTKCYLTSVSKQGKQMLAIIPYKSRLIQTEERIPFVVLILGFCSFVWRFKLCQPQYRKTGCTRFVFVFCFSHKARAFANLTDI